MRILGLLLLVGCGTYNFNRAALVPHATPRLDTGQLNPLATGVLLSDARIGVVQIGGTYALVATGTLQCALSSC